MRKLALSDEILLSVDKAARYIGGEVNSVMKNLDGIICEWPEETWMVTACTKI